MEMIVRLYQLFLKPGHVQLGCRAAGIRHHGRGKSGGFAGLRADGNQADGIPGTAVTGDDPPGGIDVVDFAAHQAAVGNLDAVRLNLLLGAAVGVL